MGGMGVVCNIVVFISVVYIEDWRVGWYGLLWNGVIFFCGDGKSIFNMIRYIYLIYLMIDCNI